MSAFPAIRFTIARWWRHVRVRLAQWISPAEKLDIYTAAREHERDDVMDEIAKFRAKTGNKRIRELEDRIIEGKHRTSGEKKRFA